MAIRRAPSDHAAMPLIRSTRGPTLLYLQHRWSRAENRRDPPNEAARYRHNGALLAPGRRNPLEHRVENRVAGQRPPGRFDEHMAQATDALAADVAPPN